MPDLKPHKILVAEDNALNQRVIHDLLQFKGFEVSVVGSGYEAIEALKETEFDLLILDCRMPGMDGFTTARTIREADPSSLNNAIPILATTALATPHDHKRCLDAGMNDYLSKPLHAESLYDLVGRLLAGRSDSSDRNDASGVTANSHDQKPLPKLEKIVTAMADRLIREAENWAKTLQDLQEKDRRIEIRDLAHKIRGTADIIGFSELSNNAAALERTADAGDESAIANFLTKVVSGLRRMGEEVGKSE